MKESIQKSGSEVSVVIYDAPLPPRYLRFSKKFIKTVFIVIPLTFGLATLTLLLMGLSSKLKDTRSPSFPKMMSDEEAKILRLETELGSLNESNRILQNKLSTQGPTATADTLEEPFLMGVRRPYGMQNMMSENKVSLDQFDVAQNQNKTTFKFVIISNTPETKVTGHVLVFMLSEAGTTVYPSEANLALPNGIKYSMGEPFSVSRLRPTNAEFQYRLDSESVRFLIYIFSREGDLLLIKETESFKIGSKS